MCMSSPKLNSTPPTQYQEAKPPAAKKTDAKDNGSGMAGGSLLTGPSGVQVAAGNIGGNTLLGN